MENNTAPKVDQAAVDALTAEILKPMETFEKNQSASTDEDVNPNYISCACSCSACRRLWMSTPAARPRKPDDTRSSPAC